MKKLLLLFLLSFIVIFSFAQFPTYQPVGSPTTLWDQKGAVRGVKGLINGSYTDTTAANADQIDFYPGAQIFTTSDDQIWVRDATATRWINVTTGFSPTPACGLQSGTGIVHYDSLLIFSVTAANYSLCCDNIPRTTLADSIKLPAADPSNPVWVAIILDATGVNYVRGVPAANPSLPQLTDCQIALTYVLINAGDIVPANVSVTTIYDENYTSEWDSVTTSTLVMDTANTTFPVHLLKDIDVTSYGTGGWMTFRTATTVDLNNYGILKFYVRLKGVATIRFSLTWYLDGVQQTFSAVPLVVSGITGVYQVMAIPISAFRILNNSSVNTLRIQVFGTQGFYLDWIQLQAGIIPSSPIDNGFTTLNVGNLDSLFNSFVTFPIGQPVVNYTKQNVPAYTALVNPNNTNGPFVWTKINLATPIITGLLPVTNIAPGGSNYVLTTVGGVATWVASTPGYDTTFVVNGLHVIPGVTSDTLSLGGSLRENVTIATVASTLTISTATSTVNPLAVTSTTGNTITTSSTNGHLFYGVTTNGDGFQVFTTNGTGGTGVSVAGVGLAGQSTNGLAGSYTVTPSSTNTIVPVLQVNRGSSGTAANGIGGSIDFVNQKVTGGGTLSNRIISKWSNAVAANATSQLIFTGINNASPDTLLRFNGDGLLTLNQYTTSNFNGGVAADSVLVVTSAGVVKKRDAASFGGGGSAFNGAGNGLTDSSGRVILGGSLYKNTTVNTAGFTTTWTGLNDVAPSFTSINTGAGEGVRGQSTSGPGASGLSTSGYGLQANSTSGFGIYAQSSTNIAIEAFSNDTYAGYFITKPTSTNVVVPIFHVEAQSDGTAANGMGGSIEYYLEVSTNANQLSNELISKWTDATLATRTSQFIITGVNSASTGDILTLNGNKSIQANGYGSGTFTGTATYTLQVDASGNIIEGSASSTPTLQAVTDVGSLTSQTITATAFNWTVGILSSTDVSGDYYGNVQLKNEVNSNVALVQATTLTASRTYELPDMTGTVLVATNARATAQVAANTNVLTYTVGTADGTYQLDANVLVTTSTLHSISVTVDYTDESNVARTVTIPFAQLAGTLVTLITNGTGAGPYEGVALTIRAKAATTIVFKTAGTFTTVTYNVDANIVKIN